MNKQKVLEEGSGSYEQLADGLVVLKQPTTPNVEEENMTAIEEEKRAIFRGEDLDGRVQELCLHDGSVYALIKMSHMHGWSEIETLKRIVLQLAEEKQVAYKQMKELNARAMPLPLNFKSREVSHE